MRPAIFLFGLALLFHSTAARANPDIWVEASYLFHVEGQSIARLTLDWRFDRYFSNRTVADFDSDSDGVLTDQEAERLRQATFAPLAQGNYHLHVLAGGDPRDFTVADFDARVEGDALVYRFAVRFAPAVPYRNEAMIVSLHDDENIMDFSFAEQNFLLVDGPFDSACKFRIARGKGSLVRHQRTIAIVCGE